MLPTWLEDVLKANGMAGAFIFVLILANIAIARIARSMIREKDKRIAELHEQRANERETLVRLLEGANTAQRLTAETTAKKTEALLDLTAAIMVQSNASDRLNDRVSGQAEMFKEKLGDFKHVVDSFGESNRVMTGIVTEIRNGLINLIGGVQAMHVDVKKVVD